MCKLCDRVWLGMFNLKCGQKHVGYTKRLKSRWNTGFNQYHISLTKRYNRAYTYNPKTDSLRRYR